MFVFLLFLANYNININKIFKYKNVNNEAVKVFNILIHLVNLGTSDYINLYMYYPTAISGITLI